MPQGDLLEAFAEATLGADDDALASARETLLQALGPEALVDAAGVVANFSMMTRVADATGIPLDGVIELATQQMRSDMGIESFEGSANTAQGGVVRSVLGKLVQPIVPAGFAVLKHLKPKLR